MEPARAVATSPVSRGYEARKRIASLGFPDRRGNQTWTYESDGVVASITTQNAISGEAVINRYSYNKRRLLADESVQQAG